MSDVQARPSFDGQVRSAVTADDPVVDLLTGVGFAGDHVRGWIADSIALAARPLGEAAADAAAAPLLVRVYREIESIERARRAEILVAITRRLCRTLIVMPGAAVLDLAAPLDEDACERLQREFARERKRDVSERLFEGVRRSGAIRHRWSSLVEGGAATTPGGLLRDLSTLACALRPGFDASLAVAEVEAACGEATAAECALLRTSDEIDAAQSSTSAHDLVARVCVAAAFLAGDGVAALAILDEGALALDRSASAGALRACARHLTNLPPARHDEFGESVGPDERRRIARFLAGVHPAPDVASEPGQ
ncbi:MAG: hypothetical protein AAGA20_18360 [Planctomycetota bacterium]